jgi:polygalacturonase
VGKDVRVRLTFIALLLFAVGVLHSQTTVKPKFDAKEVKTEDLIVESPVLDVRAWNAKGNGSSDDTTKIQAAIDALPSAGGVIYFPEGIWIVSPQSDQAMGILDLPASKKVEIRGVGAGRTIIKVADSSDRYQSIINGNTNDTPSVEISGITFDHNIANNGFSVDPATDSNHQRTILLDYASEVWIHHIEVKNSSSVQNIYTGAGMESVIIESNIFHDLGYNPNSIRHDSSIINVNGEGRHIIRNNIIRGSGVNDAAAPGQYTGIETHSSNTLVDGNLIENMRRGINLTGSSAIEDVYNVVASNNTMDNVGQGIKIWSNVGSGSATTYGMTNTLVVNNTIQLALNGTWKNAGGASLTPFGITLTSDADLDARNINISNNTILGTLETELITVVNGSNTGIGWVSNTSQVLENSIIANNVIEDYPLGGIRFKCDMENVRITGNVLRNVGHTWDGVANGERRTPIAVNADNVIGALFAHNRIYDDTATLRYAYGFLLDVATSSSELVFLDNEIDLDSAVQTAWLRIFHIVDDTPAPLIRGYYLQSLTGWQGTKTIAKGSRYIDPSTGTPYAIDADGKTWDTLWNVFDTAHTNVANAFTAQQTITNTVPTLKHIDTDDETVQAWVGFDGATWSIKQYDDAPSMVTRPVTINVTAPTDSFVVNADGSTTIGTSLMKNGPFFDVRAWGAVGDGSTDDTAAIQAAIDAAEAAGIGTVLLSGPGLNRTTAMLTVQTAGLSIVGNATRGGTSGLKIDHAGTGLRIDAAEIHLENFEIDGNDTGGSPCIEFYDAMRSTMTRVRVHDCLGDGIQIDPHVSAGNDNGIVLYKTTSNSNGGDGLEVVHGSDGDINSTQLLSCEMGSNTGNGAVIRGDNVLISGGQYNGNTLYGIAFGDAADTLTTTTEGLLLMPRMEANTSGSINEGDGTQFTIYTLDAYQRNSDQQDNYYVFTNTNGFSIGGSGSGGGTDKAYIAFKDGREIRLLNPGGAADQTLTLRPLGTGVVNVTSDLKIGAGADASISLTFNRLTSDKIFKWDEADGRFEFNTGLLTEGRLDVLTDFVRLGNDGSVSGLQILDSNPTARTVMAMGSTTAFNAAGDELWLRNPAGNILVETSTHFKAGPFFDVRAWGAVGDGSTDDSTEFQAAIDAAEAANGSVLVPQGTYAINAALTIDTKITMVGSGRPVLKVDSLASGSALNITGSGARGTRVEGIIIQDSSVARTKAGMSISTVAWITLRDVEFIGLLTGLTLNSVHDARGFEGLGFYENATDVLFSTTASTSITFRDSRFENTTTAIINDGNLPLTNIGFYGCGFAPTLASQGNAVEFDGTAFTNLTFSGCRFEVNTTTGKSNNLLIDGQSTSIPTTGLVIENNYFTGDAEHHVVIDTYVKNPTISGNTFFTDPNVDDIDFNPTSALFLYPIIMGNVKYHERTPNTMIVNGTIPAPKMVFDTLAYGCTGDGTVDDTTCVQAAIDAAEATGNGTVVLSGWHNVTSTITVESDGVRIVGNGTSGSNSGLLLAHTGVGLKVDAQRVYLGDFEIDGQSDTYGSPCLQLIESRQSTIERLNIYDCLTDGIRVDPEATNPAGVANWIRFRDVDVSSCGDDGIEIMTYDASTCSAENAPFDCCTGAGAGCTKTEINQHHLLFDGVNSRSNVDDGIVLRGDQQVIVGGDYGSNDVGIRFGETGDDNETENAIVKQARLEGNATSFWAAGDNACCGSDVARE